MTKRQASTKGFALIIVLIAMAISSVLVLGMLNSTAVHAQVASTAVTRAQATCVAESGLNLAVYYLKNPKASPVALVYGANGNVHYPGETGISIAGLPGTITLTVTNPANGQFQITSVGTYDGTSVTASATMNQVRSKQFTYATYFNGAVSLTNKIAITGGLITNGSLQQAYTGQISGTITTASAGSATDRQNTDFTFPISMFYYLPTYFYQGKRCTAATLSTNYTGGVLYDSNVYNNPANVWYVSKNGVKFSNTTLLTGSLVAASGISLNVSGTVIISPKPTMPALATDKDLTFTANNTTLTCNGPTFVGGQVKGSGGTPQCNFNVNGVFISSSGGFPVHNTYKGNLTFQYLAAQAKTVAFADEMETVQSVSNQSWEPDTSRPQ